MVERTSFNEIVKLKLLLYDIIKWIIKLEWLIFVKKCKTNKFYLKGVLRLLCYQKIYNWTKYMARRKMMETKITCWNKKRWIILPWEALLDNSSENFTSQQVNTLTLSHKPCSRGCDKKQYRQCQASALVCSAPEWRRSFVYHTLMTRAPATAYSPLFPNPWIDATSPLLYLFRTRISWRRRDLYSCTFF